MGFISVRLLHASGYSCPYSRGGESQASKTIIHSCVPHMLIKWLLNQSLYTKKAMKCGYNPVWLIASPQNPPTPNYIKLAGAREDVFFQENKNLFILAFI